MHIRVDGTGCSSTLREWVGARRSRPAPETDSLLLHGGPGFDHSTFEPAFSALADLVQIAYLDHRGIGRVVPVRPTAGRWHSGARISGIRDALGIERPIMFGHPRRLRRPGLCDAVSGSSRQADPVQYCSAGDLRRVLAAFERRLDRSVHAVEERFWRDINAQTMADYVRECCRVHGQARDRSRRGGPPDFRLEVCSISAAGGEFWRMDFTAALSRIRCPTLVLAGSQDPVTPLADSEDILAALPPGLARFIAFADVVTACFAMIPSTPSRSSGLRRCR